MLWSFAYLVVRNLFALVWLLARPRGSKELEILVLRHEFGHISPTASRTGSPRFCGWNRRESSASGCSPRTRTFGRALSSWPSPLAYEPELKWYLRAGQGLRVCECERLGGGRCENSISLQAGRFGRADRVYAPHGFVKFGRAPICRGIVPDSGRRD